MRVIKNRLWTWIINNKSKIKKQDVNGKYLFFSSDNRLLFKKAKKILKESNLPLARITKEKSRSVLFVYDKKPELETILNRYNSPEIQYKNWSKGVNKEKINSL